MYPKLKINELADIKLSKEVELFDMIKNWKQIQPHLTSNEIIEALKEGFDDHFQTKEELEEYPWDNPRLDGFGAIGFAELHEIMDEETFKDYIGEDYEAYFDYLKKMEEDNLEDEDWKDWVKEHSYFAYRALSRCHHLSPFCYEIGKKLFPELEWFILVSPAHSNAIGIKDGKISMIMDLLWGEMHKNPEELIAFMFEHSVRILNVQIKRMMEEIEEGKLDEVMEEVKKEFMNMKEKLIS